MKRSFTTALTVFALLLAIGRASRQPTAQTGNQATSTSKTLQVAGLHGKVIIRRDERGIPYVEAQNDEDLYFAQGYATASDRLWQMDLFRRNARGELTEIFGAGPSNSLLEEDKRHRTFGFAQTADAEVAQASPKARALLEAYARGVNACIASLDKKSLPPEFQLLQYRPRAWTPSDSLVIVKNFFESLSSSWRLDVLREALADLAPDKRAALLVERSSLDVLVVGADKDKRFVATAALSSPNSRLGSDNLEASNRDRYCVGQVGQAEPALLRALAADAEIEARSLERIGLYSESLAASNNWVVSGKHTASGKPLLANDPHLAASAPPIWYMVHLTAPGVRVAGVTAAGLPGVIIGHNDHIAWGFTNVGPDVQDLYIEKFDPQNPHRYLTPSGWLDAEIRHEEIKVRKNPTDPATESQNFDVTVTRHGPIVFEKEGKRYALRWTALDPKLNNSAGVYGLDRATNWKGFTEALRNYTPPMQNMVYADTEGHIGYYAAGVVPIRKAGDGSVPYDGATDDGEWTNYIPFDQLPHVYDPPSGIVVTANQRIVGSDYPHFLTHSWAQPYRARRILELLQQNQKLTAEDFRAIQGDVYSIAGATFAREAARILHGQLTSPGDDQLREAITAFEKWDGQLKVESSVGPVVAQMRIAFRTRMLDAAIGPERARTFGWANFDSTLDRLITEQPPDWLPKDFKTYADLLRACYADARQALTRSLGADESKWIWGNMVKARFPHPLASVPFVGQQFAIPVAPQNGTGALLGATVNAGSSVSMRLIASANDWDQTQQGITLGESGISTNPHWRDQLEDWQKVAPRVFPFTEAAIARATQETLTLEPAK